MAYKRKHIYFALDNCIHVYATAVSVYMSISLSEKIEIKTEAEADNILNKLSKAFEIESVDKKTKKQIFKATIYNKYHAANSFKQIKIFIKKNYASSSKII